MWSDDINGVHRFILTCVTWSLLMAANIKMWVKFGSVFQHVTIKLHLFVGFITVTIMFLCFSVLPGYCAKFKSDMMCVECSSWI